MYKYKKDIKYMATITKSNLTLTDYSRFALDNLGFSSWQYLQIEKTDNQILTWMDYHGGIDWIIKNQQNEMYLAASRMRFVNEKKPKVYQDFTIRCSKYTGVNSELEKRLSSINNGSMYPNFQFCAWFSSSFNTLNNTTSSLFLCGAVARTKDVYSFVKQQPHLVKSAYSDRDFLCVNWQDMRSAGYPVLIK